MTISQLKSVMKFHLRNLNVTGKLITNDTVHREILGDDDGYGRATSMRLYKGFVRWTLSREGHEDRSWPSKWMDLSVRELAGKLIEGST